MPNYSLAKAICVRFALSAIVVAALIVAYLNVTLQLMAGGALALCLLTWFWTTTPIRVAQAAIFSAFLPLDGLIGVLTPGWLPVPPQTLLVAVACGVLVLKGQNGRAGVEASWIVLPCAALAVWLTFVSFGNGKAGAAGSVTWLVGALMVAVLARRLDSRADVVAGLRAAAYSFAVIAAAQALDLELDVRLLPTPPVSAAEVIFGEQIERFGGTYGDYELLGEAMAIGMVLLFWFAMLAKGIVRRLWYLLMVAACALVLLETGTIGAMAIGLGGIFAVVFLQPRVRVIYKVIGGAALVAGLVVANSLFTIGTVQRAIDLALTNNLGTGHGRALIWQRALDATAKPDLWVVGHGLPYPIELAGTWPHSTYLSLFIAGGVTAVVLFLLIYGLSVARLIIALLKHESAQAAVLLTILVMILADGIKIEFLRADSLVLGYFAFLALVAVDVSRRRLPTPQPSVLTPAFAQHES